MAAGCTYRVKQLYNAMKQYSSTEKFMQDSPFLPPVVKSIYAESREQATAIKKEYLTTRLPRPTNHELQFAQQASTLEESLLSP